MRTQEVNQTFFSQETLKIGENNIKSAKMGNHETYFGNSPSTECPSTNPSTPDFAYNQNHMEEERNFNGLQEECIQVNEIKPNQYTFTHQSESFKTNYQNNFALHPNNEETKAYGVTQTKRDSFFVSNVQDDFQTTEENSEDYQFPFVDIRNYCSQEEIEHLSNVFCWEALDPELRENQDEIYNQGLKLQIEEQYCPKYDCFGNLIDISGYGLKEFKNDFNTQEIESLLETFSLEGPDICAYCVKGSKLRFSSKMKHSRRRETCLCNVMKIDL